MYTTQRKTTVMLVITGVVMAFCLAAAVLGWVADPLLRAAILIGSALPVLAWAYALLTRAEDGLIPAILTILGMLICLTPMAPALAHL